MQQSEVPMWEHYKKTFRTTQIVIGVVTMGLLIWSHRIAVAAMFFMMMQLGSVLGALWAARLKGMFEHQKYRVRARHISQQ
jgi:hypothetical protein